MLQAGEDVGYVVEQVAEDEDDAAAAGAAGELVEGAAEVGGAAGRRVGECPARLAELVHLPGRAQERPHPAGHRRQPDAVRLPQHEVAHRRRRRARQVVLREPPRAVLHRLAGVNDEPRDEVGLLLVLLEVEPLGAAVDLPVDVLDVVAGGVLAVLRELDREPVPRAPVPPGEVALDELPRLQFEAVDAGENRRIRERRHGYRSPSRGTSASSFRTISSGVTRSASAL